MNLKSQIASLSLKARVINKEENPILSYGDEIFNDPWACASERGCCMTLSLEDMVKFQIMGQRPRRKMHSNKISETWPELPLKHTAVVPFNACGLWLHCTPWTPADRLGILPENHQRDSGGPELEGKAWAGVEML